MNQQKFKNNVIDLSWDEYQENYNGSRYGKNEDIELKILMKELPKIQATIIYLRYFERYKINEIASKIQMSRQSVYRNKKRALDKLKVLLNG